jgi:hypothetical protein
MRYSSLLRMAALALVAAGALLVLPGQATLDFGAASAWADDGEGNSGRQCPGGR